MAHHDKKKPINARNRCHCKWWKFNGSPVKDRLPPNQMRRWQGMAREAALHLQELS